MSLLIDKPKPSDNAILSFKQHMENKIDNWNPYSLHVGLDFAVFEFNFPYQCDSAHVNLEYHQDYYGYTSMTDGKDKLVVINTGKGCTYYGSNSA